MKHTKPKINNEEFYVGVLRQAAAMLGWPTVKALVERLSKEPPTRTVERRRKTSDDDAIVIDMDD